MQLRCEHCLLASQLMLSFIALVLCPEVKDCVLLMDSMRAVGHLLNECLSV